MRSWEISIDFGARDDQEPRGAIKPHTKVTEKFTSRLLAPAMPGETLTGQTS